MLRVARPAPGSVAQFRHFGCYCNREFSVGLSAYMELSTPHRVYIFRYYSVPVEKMK